MANSWFRMYSEFATDPKVQMLSEADQRRLTMLFCLRCNGHVTLQDTEVTFLLRITDSEWEQTKSNFIDKGFIDSDNKILNWDKRQFVSDSSKNRVAAYRERKKQQSNGDVTLQKRKSNAIDTDTDTDTEQKYIYTSEFEQFWTAYPKKTGKDAAFKSWKKLKPRLDDVMFALSWQRDSKQWSDGYIPNPSTYLNQGRWKDQPADEIIGDPF